ncbi:MAG TPA: hypothetical protein VD866_21985, partial [Urbifossiella sp.]|nr:hypothetical protein [Urbifossiella sp.]
MTRGLTVCLLLVAAAAAPAQDEVPLDKLTAAQVQARLLKVMADPAAKARLDNVLKALPTKVEIDAKAVEFQDAGQKVVPVFVPGKTKLVWRYKSDTPLEPDQARRVTELMQQVLAEAMNQDREGGKTLVTTTDWTALSKDVTIARLVVVVPTKDVPVPTANGAPTIKIIADRHVTAGDTARVRFTIGDDKTPEADLRVTSESSNPGLLPPASQSITPISPDGVVQELVLVTTQT